MAITFTDRLGLHQWNLGGDPYSRAQRNADNLAINNLAAIDLQVADLAARPAAGVRGRYCFVEATGRLYRDTGVAWREVDIADDAGVAQLLTRGRGASIYQSVSHNVLTATLTRINLNAVDLDPLGMHNGTGLVIPAGLAGWWRFSGQAALSNNTSSYRSVRINVNGSSIATLFYAAVNAAVSSTMPAHRIAQLAEGDVIELHASQGSGSTLTTTAGSSSTWLEAMFIGKV